LSPLVDRLRLELEVGSKLIDGQHLIVEHGRSETLSETEGLLFALARRSRIY